jgi:hypothetical protein
MTKEERLINSLRKINTAKEYERYLKKRKGSSLEIIIKLLEIIGEYECYVDELKGRNLI